MEVFVKSFATYRTIKKATAIASSLVVDSLDYETSSVTVKGTDINRSDTGNWLICDGEIYLISNVKPESDRTVLTLSAPLDAFNRPLEFVEQASDQTIGAFVAAMLTGHWVTGEDPVYAMAYLVVSNSDTFLWRKPPRD